VEKEELTKSKALEISYKELFDGFNILHDRLSETLPIE